MHRVTWFLLAPVFLLTPGAAIAARLWDAFGVPICGETCAASGHFLVEDGAGGIYAAWQDDRGPNGEVDAYLQRLTAAGQIGGERHLRDAGAGGRLAGAGLDAGRGADQRHPAGAGIGGGHPWRGNGRGLRGVGVGLVRRGAHLRAGAEPDGAGRGGTALAAKRGACVGKQRPVPPSASLRWGVPASMQPACARDSSRPPRAPS